MTSEQLPFYIGRYKVTGQLGSGGMGVVYLAIDERLNRRVAVKRLVKNPTSSTAHLRIRKEALLLAQLNHSNIVQIYDVVEERDDVALVMEYVDGSSLDKWQRERNPNLQQKLQRLKQICHGLARAHSIGIIHRDLKPDNILVDENNTAKITDFGIAKNWRENSDLTREQHVAGSWGAMSPEQALGKPLDNRCDLFALGVLAYQLLCGQNPFGASDSPFVTVDRIVNNQHPPAAKLNPELPEALCQLLDKLMAKNPDKRPPNATAVAAELDAILQRLEFHDGSTFTRTMTVTAESYHRRKQRSRGWHKLLIGGALAGASVALATALYAMLPAAPSAPDGKYIAVVSPQLDPTASRESRLLVSNVLSAIKQDLSNREGLFLVPYSESQSLSGLPLREQARALNAQLLLNPTISCEKIQCEASLELIDTTNFAAIASRSATLEKNAIMESRVRTQQQVNYLLPQYPARDRDSQINISAAEYQRYLEVFAQRKDYAHTTETLNELEALLEKNPGFPLYYELLAELLNDERVDTGNDKIFDRLEQYLQRAPREIVDHPALMIAELRLTEFRGDPDRARELLAKLRVALPDQARYYQLSALYYHAAGDFQRALEAIDQALARRTSAAYLRQKALTLTSLGRMDEAKAYLLQALELSEDNIDVVSLLAGNELDSGRPQETIRLLTTFGLERIGSVDTYNLCLAYYIEKQLDRAQQCFSRVVERAPGDADPLLYKAEIARAQNLPQQAQQFAERALQVASAREDWEGQLMLARAYAELGHAGRAVEALLKIRRRAPDDLYVNYGRAQVYMACGDLVSAKAHIRKTLEQGVAPIWFTTGGFAPVCSREDFADLRRDYPALCAAKPASQVAQNSASGDER